MRNQSANIEEAAKAAKISFMRQTGRMFKLPEDRRTLINFARYNSRLKGFDLTEKTLNGMFSESENIFDILGIHEAKAGS